MIEMLSTIDRSTCLHCGLPISKLQGDLTRHPYWCHDDQGDGRLRRECPGTLYAEPAAHPEEGPQQ